MYHIYQREADLAASLSSSSDRLSYQSSILRSLLQTIAIAALEANIQATPTLNEDVDLKQFIDRFSQPSDGLPVEILDALTPRIRSLVFRHYLTGWFEKGQEEESIAELALQWVEFRNRRPAHGVLDEPTTTEWARRSSRIIQRILESANQSLPCKNSGIFSATIGDVVIPVSIPLELDDHAMVIGRIMSKKGVWKAQGHLLSWKDAREINLDLSPSNIFSLETRSLEKFRWTEVPLLPKSTLVLNNIPGRQTSNFVGRKKELDKLKYWLRDFEDSRSCLVYGDGGFGKTTLVLEFFNRLLEGDFSEDIRIPSVISFYTAKKTKWTEEGLVHFKGLTDAMEDCVRELMYCLQPILGKEWYKIEGRGLVDKAASQLANESFSRDDVLLIIDNTETLATSNTDAEELGEFLALVAKRIGRVVITSRRRELLAAEPIAVSQLSDTEAISLLQELGTEYGARAITQAGDPRLRQVCHQLMCKPLLIDTLVRPSSTSTALSC